MTAPESTEQLLAAWRELEAERERRFKEKMDAGEAVRVRYMLDDLSGETETEAQIKAHAELPEKDKGKAVGWLRRSIIRPIVDAISPPQDTSTKSPPAVVEPISHSAAEPPVPKSSTPPPVFEPREGIVRIQTGQPDHASPQGYCEIGHWKLNARGELVLRDEGGALLREHRLEPGQDPAAMALKLLRAWWSSDRGADFGRRLQYPSDDWMA